MDANCQCRHVHPCGPGTVTEGRQPEVVLMEDSSISQKNDQWVSRFIESRKVLLWL